MKFNSFKNLEIIADNQLGAILEKHNSKRYTLRKYNSPISYISFEMLIDVAYYLTSKGMFLKCGLKIKNLNIKFQVDQQENILLSWLISLLVMNTN